MDTDEPASNVDPERFDPQARYDAAVLRFQNAQAVDEEVHGPVRPVQPGEEYPVLTEEMMAASDELEAAERELVTATELLIRLRRPG